MSTNIISLQDREQNNLDNIIYWINQRIQKVFEKEYCKHQDIFSLIEEVENWTPTRLECKAYEELKYRFHNLFLLLKYIIYENIYKKL